MKLLSFSLLTAGMILLASCGNTTRFPVSSVVPAADIKASTKIDKNKNKVLTINAKNLAAPERIDPSSKAYVIWGKSDDEAIRNLGQLQNNNAGNATLTTITPEDIDEIIITAEPTGSVTAPSGTEISRVELGDEYIEEPPVREQPTPETPETPATPTEPGQDPNYPFGTPSDTLKRF